MDRQLSALAADLMLWRILATAMVLAAGVLLALVYQMRGKFQAQLRDLRTRVVEQQRLVSDAAASVFRLADRLEAQVPASASGSAAPPTGEIRRVLEDLLDQVGGSRPRPTGRSSQALSAPPAPTGEAAPPVAPSPPEPAVSPSVGVAVSPSTEELAPADAANGLSSTARPLPSTWREAVGLSPHLEADSTADKQELTPAVPAGEPAPFVSGAAGGEAEPDVSDFQAPETALQEADAVLEAWDDTLSLDELENLGLAQKVDPEEAEAWDKQRPSVIGGAPASAAPGGLSFEPDLLDLDAEIDLEAVELGDVELLQATPVPADLAEFHEVVDQEPDVVLLGEGADLLEGADSVVNVGPGDAEGAGAPEPKVSDTLLDAEEMARIMDLEPEALLHQASAPAPSEPQPDEPVRVPEAPDLSDLEGVAVLQESPATEWLPVDEEVRQRDQVTADVPPAASTPAVEPAVEPAAPEASLPEPAPAAAAEPSDKLAEASVEPDTSAGPAPALEGVRVGYNSVDGQDRISWSGVWSPAAEARVVQATAAILADLRGSRRRGVVMDLSGVAEVDDDVLVALGDVYLGALENGQSLLLVMGTAERRDALMACIDEESDVPPPQVYVTLEEAMAIAV